MHRETIYRVRLPFVGTIAFAHDAGEAKFSDGLLFYTDLVAEHYRAGTLLDRHELGSGLITVSLVNTMVSDAVTGTSVVPTLARYSFMDSGTGTTAATDVDSALQTPTGTARVTTILTNSQTATALNHAAILKYTGTITYSSGFAVTEWGLLDSLTLSGGAHMMDHRIFSAITVSSGDSITFNYSLTLPSNN